MQEWFLRNHLKSKTFCLCLCNYAVLFDEYPLGIGRKCMVTPPEALARATSNMGNRFLEPSVLTQHHQQCNSPLASFCSLTTSLTTFSVAQHLSEVVHLRLWRMYLGWRKWKLSGKACVSYAFQLFKQKTPQCVPSTDTLGTRKPPTCAERTIETAKGLCPFRPPPLALAGSEWVAWAKVFPAADFQCAISGRLAGAV